eukprot:jgi/Psemu1/300547/fgenesh1_kg.14_\
MKSDSPYDDYDSAIMYGELPEDLDDVAVKPAEGKGSGGGIQFKSEEQIKEISRSSGYEIEEITKYWGEAHDHALRKSELRKDVRDFALNNRTSDSDFTTLGIDDKFGEGRQVKKANRNLSRSAVIEEQTLQKFEGILDDELMRGIYTITAEEAKKTARKKAERLHKALVTDEK